MNQKNKLFRVLKLATAFSLLFVFGQNCSVGFQPDEYISSVDLSSITVKGKTLYETNCSSCHGSFVTSTKLGKSASQISQAVFFVPQMAGLKKLDYSDLQAISTALNNPVTGGPGPIYKCVDPNSRGITADQMRRLSSKELKNTLSDLLGTAVFNDSVIQTKVNGLPSDTLQISIGEINNTPPNFLAQVLLEISVRAVELMDASPAQKAAILGSCANTVNEACVRTVIADFGRKVLRRPPTTAEANNFVAFYNTTGGGSTGLNNLFMRLLQSPALVYHIEEGTTPSNGRLRLSDYEIASRISYMTADSIPDSLLLDAAGRGELQSLQNVRSHVSRYLLKLNGQAKANDFFRYYAQMNSVPNPNLFAAKEIGILSVTGLGAEMKQEVSDFINYVVFMNNGTFKDLMTSPASFPKSNSMSRILEAPQVTQAQPVSTSASHIGLLHRPAVLASSAPRTSPIHRGALIRKVLLCDPLGDPPNDALIARAAEVGDLSGLSNRDGTDRLTGAPQCIGCHSLINNLGYLFENYSQLGARRPSEPLFDASGNLIRTFPVDTSVSDPKIEAGGPTRLTDSQELVNALASSPKAQACYTKKMFEYYSRRPADASKDGCALANTEQKTGTQDLKSVLIDSIANEDIFWRKQP